MAHANLPFIVHLVHDSKGAELIGDNDNEHSVTEADAAVELEECKVT